MAAGISALLPAALCVECLTLAWFGGSSIDSFRDVLPFVRGGEGQGGVRGVKDLSSSMVGLTPQEKPKQTRHGKL